ncbi:MAG TPA: DUF2892 domain-containing protein [Parafilimonas sp.]|nr:DUF2892 domain-containing protein [Parafilimonas sp.]
MKKNVGAFDRVFRVLVAALITVLFFTDVLTGTSAIILLVIAGIFLITGFISVCPLYSLFGINTSSRKRSNDI